MKNKVIKSIIRLFCVIMVIAGAIYLIRPAVITFIEEEQAKQAAWEAYLEKGAKLNTLVLDEVTEEISVKKQISMKLPDGITPEEIQISNDYLTRTVSIKLPHVEERYFKEQPLAGRSDNITQLSYASNEEHDVIWITTDKVYELDVTYDEKFCYIDFLDPHEVYESVVVIDAGHGGRDPGANRKGIEEKDIDLGIVLALKELLDATEHNIGVYYTRTDDSNPSNDERVDLANKSGADLFISVHINSFKGNRDSSVNGTEVMYHTGQKNGFTSKNLAEICMEELTAALGSRNRGIVSGDAIYIINQSEVPVALVEVGFITNKEERELLNTKDYQEKTAEGLYKAIIRALGEK